MTDTQILTLAIAIVFPAVAMAGSIAALVYSNKRLDDMKTDLKTTLDTRFDALQKHVDAKIDTGFEHMEMLLKLHEAEHHKH